MNKILLTVSLLVLPLCVRAADTKISAMPAATSINSGDVVPIIQSATNKKATFTVQKDYWDGFYAQKGANTDITSVLLNQTGLVVKGASSNALTIKPNETLSAARTLNFVTNDASRTIDLSGNLQVDSPGAVISGSSSGSNTGDQTITLTGDVTGSGTGSFATTLATVNSNVGSFTNANITVNAKGLITAASNGSGGGGGLTSTTVQVSGSDFTNATTSLANITGLTFAATSSHLYEVDGVLVTQSDDGNGVLVELAYSSTSVSRYYVAGWGDFDYGDFEFVNYWASINSAPNHCFGTVSNSDYPLFFHGTVRTTGSGNITLKIAACGGSGTAKVLIGSRMTITTLN